MAHIYDRAYFGDKLVPVGDANLSVASSAVLYGLSVYTVLAVHVAIDGRLLAFRIADHYRRLIDSVRIIGIDTFEPEWPEQRFVDAVKEVVTANEIHGDVFVRAAVHVNELLPRTRSRGLKSDLSMFVYEASQNLPEPGARLKTSVWRRTPDYAIPSRAKVCGAYVNVVLAKQDALDSGYDDCVMLDESGHVCELSAGNIFIVRHETLITPGTATDLLEGLSRKTVIEIAKYLRMPVIERDIDLTELYVADEVFGCGTSVYITPVIEVDARRIRNGEIGPVTKLIKSEYGRTLRGENDSFKHLLIQLN